MARPVSDELFFAASLREQVKKSFSRQLKPPLSCRLLDVHCEKNIIITLCLYLRLYLQNKSNSWRNKTINIIYFLWFSLGRLLISGTHISVAKYHLKQVQRGPDMNCYYFSLKTMVHKSECTAIYNLYNPILLHLNCSKYLYPIYIL